MSEPFWGGIRSGRFSVFALGRDRDVVVDLEPAHPSVLIDLGGPEPTPCPDHLLAQLLDMLRAVTPVSEANPERVAELRAENGARQAAGDYDCVFDYEDDPAGIPEGYGCGGCACHLSAPCRHCLNHLPDDESGYISVMTGLLGR